MIRVKDRGTGIPKSIVDRIFDPFFSTRDTGLGLGLPVALNIVTEHGGKIAVEQVPDYSTCIAVSLPLSRQ